MEEGEHLQQAITKTDYSIKKLFKSQLLSGILKSLSCLGLFKKLLSMKD